jgi:XTP/dITP diphosphohydrolase
VPEAQRGAQFLCVLLALGPYAEEHVFQGVCMGRLLHAPRGDRGFGYDPLFVPDGQTASFAEIPEDTKNRISHRALAWAKMAAWIVARTRSGFHP